MIDDGILDGDYVVVEEQDEVHNGDIVVALLDNGLATLKRFFREATRIRLEPGKFTDAADFCHPRQSSGKSRRRYPQIPGCG